MTEEKKGAVESEVEVNEEVNEEVNDDQADFESGYSLDEEIKAEMAKVEVKDDGQDDAQDESQDEEIEEKPSFEQTVLAKLEELEKISSRIRNVEGRYGSLNRDFNRLVEAQKELERAKEEKTKEPKEPEKTIADIVKSGAKVSALKDDWPELLEAITEAAEAIEGRRGNPDDLISKVMEQVQQARPSLSAEEIDNKITEARNKARLDIDFPNWETTINTNEFHDWFVLQDSDVKAKFNSPRVEDAADVLSRWTESRAPSQELAAPSRRNTNRLGRAIDPTDGRTPAPRAQRLTEQEEFEQGYKSA